MRGGSLVLYAWGTLLLVFTAINAVWTTDWIQVAMYGFADLVIYGTATVLWMRNREAIRRGPPPSRITFEAVPRASSGALMVGVGLGVILFGAVFGDAFLFIGGALLIAALVRVTQEMLAQRRSMARLRRGELAHPVGADQPPAPPFPPLQSGQREAAERQQSGQREAAERQR